MHMQGILVEEACVNPIWSLRANGLNRLVPLRRNNWSVRQPAKSKNHLILHVLALDSAISGASINISAIRKPQFANLFVSPPEARTARVHTSSLARLCTGWVVLRELAPWKHSKVSTDSIVTDLVGVVAQVWSSDLCY